MTSDRLDQLGVGVSLSQTRTDRPSANYVTARYCVLNELVPSQASQESVERSHCGVLTYRRPPRQENSSPLLTLTHLRL